MENKFDQREQELKSEIANEEIETLKNKLHKLTQEKYNLYEELEKFSNKVSELEVDRESLLEEKKSLRERLEEESNFRSEMTNESRKIERKIGELNTGQKELYRKVLCLCEQLREKEESCKKIKKEFKDKLMLSSKIEELHREKDALNKELSEQWYRIREITKKNKYLSKELNKKSEELDKANGLIEDQFSELDRIREDCDNKVRSLKNLLLKRDANAEQLEPKPLSLLCEQSVFKILNEELVRCNS
ncbi:hypothetical protein [Wolbachia endosymbiont (group B) of Gerris lacustris]|uniref:hypothetical protein n=1 Tax=Wolbachia endosymbiont (group B) of Gerris lacustris TaxID=3066159 RepID=UPI00333EE370